jgi:WD40 repeat protein
MWSVTEIATLLTMSSSLFCEWRFSGICCGFDSTIKIWRASNGVLEMVPRGRHSRVSSFYPNGKLVASGNNDDGTDRLWQTNVQVSDWRLHIIVWRHDGLD